MVMVTISFIIPVGLLEQLDTLVRNGDYPNRSEIIRIAIRDLLKDRTPPFTSGEFLRKHHNYHHRHYHKNVRISALRISLKAPNELKKELEKLVKDGFYPSKSEAIRVSILSFLKREVPEEPKETKTEKPIEPEELEKLEMNNI